MTYESERLHFRQLVAWIVPHVRPIHNQAARTPPKEVPNPNSVCSCIHTSATPLTEVLSPLLKLLQAFLTDAGPDAVQAGFEVNHLNWSNLVFRGEQKRFT